MTSCEKFDGLVGLDEAMAEEMSFASARRSVSVEADAASYELRRKGQASIGTRHAGIHPINEQAPSNGKDVKGACF
jgi:hypothetical protein